MSEHSYQLIVQRGPRPGEIFTLNQSTMILGRDPMSDIVINDPEISRNHARLTRTDNGYEIQDMGSTNGTYVNGKRLRGEPFLLEPDMQVILGSNVTLSYEVHEVQSELLETVLSNTDEVDEEDTPADGASTFLTGEAFEEEVHPPAAVPPTIDEPPAVDEPAASEPLYEQPAASPLTAPPPATPIPAGVDEGSEEKGKTRNYILIGAGVGLFLCCCLLGLLLLGAYYLQTEGLLDEFALRNLEQTITILAGGRPA